jgi:2-polyprenyl-3-methyl-5-hydroxy-6-metoxy-1,4-benzoquinol methylase
MRAGTDNDWKEWGKRDPYWAVLAAERFRRDALDDSALGEFFSSGREHVDHVMAVLRQNFRDDFRPLRSLDFGCGVGRVAIPLARYSENVAAIDISPAMLEEAARNAASQNVNNIEFLQTVDLDSIPLQSLDLVHSFIVFQHIPPSSGIAILQKCLRKLKPGGLGALHLTIARNASPMRRAVAVLRQRFGLVNQICNLLQGRPVSGPAIHMFTYPVHDIFWLMRTEGCGRIFVELLEHRDYLGATFYFEKAESTPL